MSTVYSKIFHKLLAKFDILFLWKIKGSQRHASDRINRALSSFYRLIRQGGRIHLQKKPPACVPAAFFVFCQHLFFDDFVDSQEIEDRIKEHIKNSGNLLNDILEDLYDVFSCFFGNNRLVYIVVLVDISLTARAVTAAVRPDSVAVAAAEASLEVTALVFRTAAKIGCIKICAVCAAVAAARDLGAVGTGTRGICAVNGKNTEANRETGKNH